MKMKHLLFTLFLTGALTLLNACASIDCPLNSTVYATYNFYQNGEPATLADTLNICLRVNGKDSLVVNRLYNSKTVNLPLSYYQATDTLLLKVSLANHRSYLDTVYISKENLPHFNKPECGTWVEHLVTQIRHTHNDLDSIVLIQPKIDTNETENFRLYFK